MGQQSRTALTWSWRLVGVGLLVWVLATQLQWDDQIVGTDGAVYRGHIHAGVPDYGITLSGYEGAKGIPVGSYVQIGRQDVAVRVYGRREVPDITYGARTLFRRLGEELPTLLLVLAGLAALVGFTALRWKLLLLGVGLRMPLLRVTKLSFIGGFFNLAVPGSTGGDFVKAWYAQKEARARYAGSHGVGTKAVLSVFVDRFLGLFGLGVFAAGVLLVTARGDAYEVPRMVVLGVLGAGVAACVILLSRGVRRVLGLSWLVRRMPFQGVLAELRGAASLYRNHLPTLGVALVISLFNHAANATACYFLARALGIEGVTLGAAMALVPIANLLSAIPLLPGGWGVGELAFAYFFGLVGVPATEAVGLSVVFRLAVLGVNLPGGLLWIFWKGHPSTETIAAEVGVAAAHSLADGSSPSSHEAPQEIP